MKLDKYLANLLLIFFTVYFSQGIFYQESSFLSKICGIMAVAICSYYFIKVLLMRSNIKGYIIALTFFIFVNVIAAIVSMMSPTIITTSWGIEISPFAVMKSMLLSLLPFFPFYYFSRNRIDITKSLKLFFITFLIISIFNYFKSQNDALAALSIDTQVTNNVSYLFVCLLPFVFLFRNKIMIYSFLGIIFYLVMISGKRGAIICVIIGIAILLYSLMQELSRKSKIRSILFILLSVFIIGYFAYETIQGSDFLQNRLELTLNGYSSGRDEIYSDAWNYFVDSSSEFQFFLGSGYLASISIFGIAAHNDWIELLLSYGLFGIILYIPVIFLPFKYFLNSNKKTSTRYITLTVASILFAQTLFSMAYQSEDNFLLSMMLGFALGYKSSNKITHNN